MAAHEAVPAHGSGIKVASYHAPPARSAAGADVHTLRCLATDIHLGFHLSKHIAQVVTSTLAASTYILFTDTTLASLHAPAVLNELRSALQAKDSKARVLSRAMPPGEGSKSRATKAELEDWMLSHGVTRDAVVLALGGGVVGDLIGFVAATFMRGVRYVQIPTTLLAMVDSAVGGKTAIDTPNGKNLVGAFHQPQYVFIDAAFLQTLPEREFSNGMAEVVKTAAIWDAADFVKLENHAPAIRSAVLGPFPEDQAIDAGRILETRSVAQTLLLDVIRGSVGVKAHIVTIDEKETGLRNLVNFGHSVGHAIEAVLTPDMLHGECISVGMILEAEIARGMVGLSQVAVGRLSRCLQQYNLPVSVVDSRIVRLPKSEGLTVEGLLDIMRVDKKNSGTEKKIVLLSRIGATAEDKASTVPDAIIARILSAGIRIVPVERAPAKAQTTIQPPGSKSVSNRALVLAALSSGSCRIKNLLHSDDTQVMMAALHDLGAASFEWENEGETVIVHGKGGALQAPQSSKDIYLQNAGTAARFMTGVCSLLTVGNSAITVTGNARMKERPIGPLVDALRSNGTEIDYKGTIGCLPLSIAPGGIKGGRIQLSASISSQYVSALLLVAPYASQEVTLELMGGVVISQPYIDMTTAMMRDFGIHAERLRDPKSGELTDSYRIPRGVYNAPSIYEVESDASSATYPLAFAAALGTQVTVPNIGSGSLQGDARFARDVLAPMGCKVEQTPTSTSVQGPPNGQLRQVGSIDMEPMTDAFLTASVLFAIAAPGEGGASSTRITGIANQRVKECNRIKAMMDELAKLGVKTQEHEDGLEIWGVHPSKLRSGVQVHCYDDHRVAMAFSILSAVVPGTGVVMDEARCTAKTWPNYWDDVNATLGLQLEGVDIQTPRPAASTSATLSTLSKSLTPIQYARDASIVCIGMRASGKTYLGGFGAAALQRPFVDADVVFNERYTLNNFVAEHGWPAFRAKETEILKELLTTKASGHLISLGGGVIESEENRLLLQEYARTRGPVVYVMRDFEEVVKFLSTSDRPSYGEPVREVFKRRRPFFYQCSSYELVSYSGNTAIIDTFDAETGNNASSGLANGQAGALNSSLSGPPSRALSIRRAQGLVEEVARYFRFISGIETNQIADLDSPGRQTFMLSLTFADVTPALSLVETLTAGVDAIELRVDLLSEEGVQPQTPRIPDAFYVATQLAALRQRTHLPVIFTVRTKSQGGMFPDDAIEEYFELIKLGFRQGCEYVDVEMRHAEDRLAAVRAHRGYSRIIASHHNWNGEMHWDSPETLKQYELGLRFGDIVKIVGRAFSPADNFALEAFRAKVSARPDAKPLIAINMGVAGQLSRILNNTLLPVTHPAMPTSGAPGQLSVVQVNQARALTGALSPQKFVLLGTPISHSLSPVLHNTGFEHLGLPHRYGLFETDAVDERIANLIRQPNFGGASVTMPFKLAIAKHLDSVSAEAQVIGAINTIIPQRPHNAAPGEPAHLVGDNTDWIAITECSRRNLSPLQLSSPDFTALVIGAGGSARAALFAMHQLGARIIWLFNRTTANAEKLAAEVPKSWNVNVIPDLNLVPIAPSAIVCNVPAQGVSLDPASGAGVVLTPAILANPKGGVVVDMAYKPVYTPLLELVDKTNAAAISEPDRHNLRQGKLWTGIPGITIVLEQGCHQFLRWTGRQAPRAEIERAAWDHYHRQNAA
ncbi:pentafunctional protein [Ceraceosorus bombacis]|uniref:Pentafunctional AROM polypeptide n=1 Tax=Ceraceosorus bombacis TaxID=401625 RepID=A0A0P1BIW6_9BASI|nr:pentafunctional protein [Ceraceosorus bombacis]